MHSQNTIPKTDFLPEVEILSQDRVSWWQDILLITIILTIFYSALLGVRPLSVPDEARYSEIPREMVVSGDYVTPRLNSIKYFEKPPLFYWMQAGSIRLFGLTELAVRLPTLILGLLGCLITYAASRVLFDRRTGWLSSLILSTSVLYFAMAHTVTLDMAVTIFLTGCLASFISAIEKPEGNLRNILLWSAYAFSGLAVLTKGLIGILLPSAVIGVWIIVNRQWRLLLRMKLLSGILIFLAITVPWHLMAQQANPEFFHFYFLEQQFLRYFTLYSKRYQPEWFFIPVLILGFFPWIIFLFQSLRHHGKKVWNDRVKQSKSLFLMIWAGIIFVFFSLSKSKLIPYILPVFPPLAILVGNYLAERLDVKKNLFRIEWRALLIGALIISVALLSIPYFQEVNDVTLTVFYTSIMALSLLISAGLTLFYKPDASLKFGLMTLVSPMVIFFILLNVAVPSIDTRSIKPIAAVLNQRIKSTDEVVAYHYYFQDLPFYLQRRVTVVNCYGELAFGMKHQDTHDFMINNITFWKKWRENNTIYAIMSLPAYLDLKQKRDDIYLLTSTKENVLVSNKK